MTEKMISLTLEQGEKTLQIAPWSPYRLILAKGLEASAWNLSFSARASADGDEYLGCHFGRRMIDLTIEAAPGALDEQMRRELISFFVPGGEGRLTVDRGIGERQIDYRLGSIRFEEPNLYGILRINIGLVCPDPWFYGKEKVLPVRQTTPLLTFPFLSVAQGGISAGLKEKIYFLYLDNLGDLPIGVTADLRVLSGSARQPYLYCGGARLTVNRDLVEGDSFSFSTCPGNPYVRVNDKDAPFLPESEFFLAQPGRNLMIVSSKSLGNMDGEIRFRERYFGA